MTGDGVEPSAKLSRLLVAGKAGQGAGEDLLRGIAGGLLVAQPDKAEAGDLLDVAQIERGECVPVRPRPGDEDGIRLVPGLCFMQ